MNKKLLLTAFGIILFGLLIRIIPLLGDNFYFTTDQGRDAVYVREIWSRYQLLLIGPETSIEGLYNGPLWYWFIAIGYLLFFGHPFGPVVLLILLNLGVTVFLFKHLTEKTSQWFAALVAGSLQFFWWFYDTSRYAFNPFPLTALSLVLVTSLSLVQPKKEKWLMLAAVAVGLTLHTQIASFLPFFLVYLFGGGWLVRKRGVYIEQLGIGVIVIALFALPHLFSELISGFAQYRALTTHAASNIGFFASTNFLQISEVFTTMLSESLFPQQRFVGMLIFFIVCILYIRYWLQLKEKPYNTFLHSVISLSFFFFLVSWGWFGMTKGWHSWQTLYIYPLLYIAVLGILYIVKRKLAYAVMAIIVLSQAMYFVSLYPSQLIASADEGLLTNQLKTVDWVYKEAEGKGFAAYTYVPSVEDYSAQYVFWWYGRRMYGYLPCEYTTYPTVPDLFVPSEDMYQDPKKSCDGTRFLIVHPDKNEGLRNQWLDALRKDTTLIKETRVGTILIEKRQNAR